MSNPVKLCASCSPQGVEQLSKYYGEGECRSCGGIGALFGYRISVLLNAIKTSAPAHTVDRMLERVLPAVRFDEEKLPTPWAGHCVRRMRDIGAAEGGGAKERTESDRQA